MKIRALDIPDVKLLCPKIFRDERGSFSETYNQATLALLGLSTDFVQDNHVLSKQSGVLRGLHFQIGASAQGKLVRVTRGSILDVTVDIRLGSPTFGKSAAYRLSAENWEQIWIPTGFAHGYCTLEPDTEVFYKVTSYYDPKNERGIQFDDPALGIQWPVSRSDAILSAKDIEYGPLCRQPIHFHYEPDQRSSG